MSFYNKLIDSLILFYIMSLFGYLLIAFLGIRFVGFVLESLTSTPEGIAFTRTWLLILAFIGLVWFIGSTFGAGAGWLTFLGSLAAYPAFIAVRGTVRALIAGPGPALPDDAANV